MTDKSWKQPTPTDIQYDNRFTALGRAIFREILALCQNSDTVINFIQGNKHYSVELKRGQCIFKVSKFAKELKIDRKLVSRNLENLSKWYSQMDIQGMPYGCIVTVSSYDSIVSMDSQKDNQWTMKGQSVDNERTSNKSVKSVKSVKSEEKKKIYKKEKYQTLESVNDKEIFKAMSERYKVSISYVEKKYERLVDYCESHGKEYKSYKAALRTFVSAGIERRPFPKGAKDDIESRRQSLLSVIGKGVAYEDFTDGQKDTFDKNLEEDIKKICTMYKVDRKEYDG